MKRRHRSRRHKSRRRRHTRKQRGGMASPIKVGEFNGVPIVDGNHEAVVFRSVDSKDPHGATKASYLLSRVIRDNDPFAADPA